MVRSIGPIGKKAGLYARVPATPPAAQGPGQVPPGAQLPQQPCQWPSQRLWALPGRRRFSPRREPPWWLPWICWCRLSLPGLLAVRADPSCIRSQGRVASLPGCRSLLPGSRRGAIVSTSTGANGNVADTTQTPRTFAVQGGKPAVHLRARRSLVCQAAGDPSRHPQAKLCSSPCRKMSLGKSMPMKTILLMRASPSAHSGPRSLPINWCTPWKITLRSVPFIWSTPL
jgi:hypothetical protein